MDAMEAKASAFRGLGPDARLSLSPLDEARVWWRYAGAFPPPCDRGAAWGIGVGRVAIIDERTLRHHLAL
jgi:hypothetical protein